MQLCLTRICDFAERTCITISQILLAAMTCVILMLVVCRYLLGFSFPWSEELARYCMIWMVLLAAAAVLRRDEHIRMDYFRGFMSPGVKLTTGLFARSAVIVYLIVMIWQGFSTAKFMAVTQSPSLGISMFLPYLALPVGGIIMLFFEIIRMAEELIFLLKSK